MKETYNIDVLTYRGKTFVSLSDVLKALINDRNFFEDCRGRTELPEEKALLSRTIRTYQKIIDRFSGLL